MNEITYEELERGCEGLPYEEFLSLTEFWLQSGDYVPAMIMNPWREESHGR